MIKRPLPRQQAQETTREHQKSNATQPRQLQLGDYMDVSHHHHSLFVIRLSG
ncbi:hypothetical protein [Rhizobium sp. CC-YZS058]|uniref:hypothetical protein n=1 Tax=Rhizobium sp. CC-YZS058 TaxID=3042153 RepID=UPI002B05BBE7|nr:hypothetical protein [Rhizobium sp. CC-YZS058]MEA3535929.1 hypothetical protein [Rhizobium sp. CC-YZS058]